MWEIYTLGGGSYLVDIFNGVAALVNSDAYTNAMEIAGIVAVFLIMVKIAFNTSFKPAATWMASFIVIYNVVMMPKVTVNIVDSMNPSLAPSQVANVPYGLAALSSLVSEIGFKMTEIAEQVYSLPVDIQYHETGMIFGSDLMAKTSSLKIVDSTFAENMNSFAKQCIFYDLALHRYTINDLKIANDIWDFLTVQNTQSSLRGIYYVSASGKEYKTCKEASVLLDAQWSAQVDNAVSVFAPSIYPGRTNSAAKALLLSDLPVSHEFLVGTSKDASGILQQQMMINALHFAMADNAATSGSTTAMDIYANARADSQTEASYRVIARKAGLQVSRMKVIFEAIYYGIFPFVFLLMLMPEGFNFFKIYAMGLAWLQIWGPMNAILHRLMMGAARENTFGQAILPDGSNGLTLITQSGIEAVNNDIAVTAGFFASTIPFLAFMLTKGAAAFGSLATSYLSISHGASSQAAQEATTGNLSIGNTNYDNHSYNNTNAHKLNKSMHIDDNIVSNIGMGGMRSSTYSDGTTVIDRSSMNSNLGDITINAAQSSSARLSQEATKHEQIANNHAATANEHYSTAYEKTVQMMQSINQQQTSGIDYSSRLSSDQSNAVDKLNFSIQKFATNEGVSEAIGGKMLASVSGSSPNFFGFKTSLEASGYGEYASRENFDKALEFSKQHNLKETLSIGTTISENQNLNISDSQGNSYNDAINNSLRQARSFDESSSYHYNLSEGLNESAANVSEKSASINKNYAQEFVQSLSSRRIEGDASGETLGISGAYALLRSNSPDKRAMVESFARTFQAEKSSEIFNITLSKLQSGYSGKYQNNLSDFKSENNLEISNKHSDMITAGPPDMNRTAIDNDNFKYNIPMQIEQNRYQVRTSDNNSDETRRSVKNKQNSLVHKLNKYKMTD
ncbi:MAG: conjugal transfer protein TraG N-terminal domain-containing protein [Proteobacteria bacterium]|nr:conjugal transfer protein TraG N-terminal domain-containing protein [Pseudomonadota bacterium]